jgi:hypothetical protein
MGISGLVSMIILQIFPLTRVRFGDRRFLGFNEKCSTIRKYIGQILPSLGWENLGLQISPDKEKEIYEI